MRSWGAGPVAPVREGSGVHELDVEAFCRRTWPRLHGALVLQLGSREAAEDVAQEALVRAWERWERVSAMANPEGWVFRVAFNLASTDRRRRRVADRVAALRPLAPLVDRTDDILSVHAALAELPPRQRAAVVLRFFADLDVAATAEVMGCAPGTVKALTSQAVQSLRMRLDTDVDEEGEVVPGA